MTGGRSDLRNQFAGWLNSVSPSLENKLIGGLPSLHLRLSEQGAIGITLDDKEPIGAVIVPKLGSSISRAAVKLATDHPDKVVAKIIGDSSFDPETLPPSAERRPELAPGSSIGHFRGWASTLGLFVMAHGAGSYRSYPAFTGSAFSLALAGLAQIGDPILSPSPPDAPRMSRNRVGTLSEFSYLVPSTTSGDDKVDNSSDIALVALDEISSPAPQNIVPDPTRPNSTLLLTSILGREKLLDKINTDVFKMGRTTGLTKGVLSVIEISQYPIRGPDGRHYLFSGLTLVEGMGNSPFVQAGDSGAAVYTDKGEVIGFVVGGNDRYCLVQPADTSLQVVNAEII